MASASTRGHLSIWDLETKTLITMLRDAHDSAITSAHFLVGQPLLLTGAGDNSIKVSERDLCVCVCVCEYECVCLLDLLSA